MIKIEINCDADGLEAHMKALGYSRSAVVPHDTWGPGAIRKSPEFMTVSELQASAEAQLQVPDESEAIIHAISDAPVTDAGVVLEPSDKSGAEANARFEKSGGITVTRVPGQPSPGKKRRTAAEKDEDDALAGAKDAAPAAKTEPTPNISTGEQRLDPQDAADEAAESVAQRDGKLTLDDVRAAFGVYQRKVGTATAITNIRNILNSPIAEIPLTQEALADAIKRIDAAINETAQEEAAPHATKADCYEAMSQYMRKYDGTMDAKKIVHSKGDITALMAKLFGPDVTGFSKVSNFPEAPENYGKLLAAINEAIRTNPFNRQVHA